MAKKKTVATPEAMRIEVSAMGSEIKALTMPEGSTVEDCLRAAGYDTSSEVRVNEEVFAGSDEVEDGDSILVIGKEKVKGGNR